MFPVDITNYLINLHLDFQQTNKMDSVQDIQLAVFIWFYRPTQLEASYECSLRGFFVGVCFPCFLCALCVILT